MLSLPLYREGNNYVSWDIPRNFSKSGNSMRILDRDGTAIRSPSSFECLNYLLQGRQNLPPPCDKRYDKPVAVQLVAINQLFRIILLSQGPYSISISCMDTQMVHLSLPREISLLLLSHGCSVDPSSSKESLTIPQTISSTGKVISQGIILLLEFDLPRKMTWAWVAIYSLIGVCCATLVIFTAISIASHLYFNQYSGIIMQIYHHFFPSHDDRDVETSQTELAVLPKTTTMTERSTGLVTDKQTLRTTYQRIKHLLYEDVGEFRDNRFDQSAAATIVPKSAIPLFIGGNTTAYWTAKSKDPPEMQLQRDDISISSNSSPDHYVMPNKTRPITPIQILANNKTAENIDLGTSNDNRLAIPVGKSDTNISSKTEDGGSQLLLTCQYLPNREIKDK